MGHILSVSTLLYSNVIANHTCKWHIVFHALWRAIWYKASTLHTRNDSTFLVAGYMSKYQLESHENECVKIYSTSNKIQVSLPYVFWKPCTMHMSVYKCGRIWSLATVPTINRYIWIQIIKKHKEAHLSTISYHYWLPYKLFSTLLTTPCTNPWQQEFVG